MKTFLAEGIALTGDLDNALHLIDEIIAQVERPRWEERLFYAETLRLKGWILSLKGDPDGAERNFLASLDWARRQQAKMWGCARQPAWLDCGRAKANARTRMSCSLRFTAGSPRASTPRICRRPRRCSMRWPERSADFHGLEWRHFFGGTGISEVSRLAEPTSFIGIVKYYSS